MLTTYILKCILTSETIITPCICLHKDDYFLNVGMDSEFIASEPEMTTTISEVVTPEATTIFLETVGIEDSTTAIGMHTLHIVCMYDCMYVVRYVLYACIITLHIFCFIIGMVTTFASATSTSTLPAVISAVIAFIVFLMVVGVILIIIRHRRVKGVRYVS